MSKYVSFKDVCKMALSMMGITNSGWVQALQGLPSIEIVHCKECTERDDDWCMYFGKMINPDDFCSYGERITP